MKNTYYAQTSGWIMGEERQIGEAIEATEEEAKYDLMAQSLGMTSPIDEKPTDEKPAADKKPAAK